MIKEVFRGKLFDIFFRIPISHKSYIIQNMRVGTITGVITYSLFGILDFYALPIHFNIAWIIRYAIILPGSVFFYSITYFSFFERAPGLWKILFILFGQLGIIMMIAVSSPSESAYFAYYAGLILVILWAGFIFRLTTQEVIIASISNILLYNIVAIFIQRLIFYPSSTNQFTHFVNNNFFLFGASFCAIIGARGLNNYWNKLLLKNESLALEQEKLNLAMKKAEESDRLKSAFLSNMSHEIRTPMNAILGFSNLLKKRNVSEEKSEQFLSIIESKSKELMQIINDIIDISKIEANQLHLELQPVNLILLLNKLSMYYTDVLEKRDELQQLELKIKPPSDWHNKLLMLDETRLNQVLTNLINNALKFTKKGSIEIGFTHNMHYLSFYVKDTGIGIPPENQTFIFERFRQSDNSDTRIYGGTGLGLSISKSIVELMGGTIYLESTKGIGSKFTFTVPHTLENQ